MQYHGQTHVSMQQIITKTFFIMMYILPSDAHSMCYVMVHNQYTNASFTISSDLPLFLHVHHGSEYFLQLIISLL